jgi:ATP-dependent Clp protease ATP-binding subunit ClpA
VVLFAPLTHDEVREIASHHLSDLAATLARSDRKLEIDEDALELLVRRGYSLAYGARFLKRAIDEHIKLPISARWKDGSLFHIVARDGELVVDCGPVAGPTGRCRPATVPGQSQANPTCSAA